MTTQDGNDYTPPRGPSAKAALAEAIAKSEASMRMVNDLVKEVERGTEAIGRVEFAVDQLKADVAGLKRRTVPPPRATEITGSFNVRDFGQAVLQAVREGERRSDTNPDTEVERVIERVENIRMGRRVRSLVTKAALAVVTLSGGWIGHVIWEAIKAKAGIP